MGMHIQIRDLKREWVIENISKSIGYTYLETCYEYDQFRDWEIYVDVKEPYTYAIHCPTEFGIPVRVSELKHDVLNMLRMCMGQHYLDMNMIIGFIELFITQEQLKCSECKRSISREHFKKDPVTGKFTCKHCCNYDTGPIVSYVF